MRGLETRVKKLEVQSGLKAKRTVYLLPCHGPDDLPGAWQRPPGTPPPKPEPHVVWLGPLGSLGWKLVFGGPWAPEEREAVVEEARQKYGSCPCSQPHPYCSPA